MAVRIEVSDSGVVTITPLTPNANADVQLTLNAILSTLSVNGQQLQRIQMDSEQLKQELQGVQAQLTTTNDQLAANNTLLGKVSGETGSLVTKVAELEALLGQVGAPITQEVVDLLAGIKVQATRAQELASQGFTSATAIDVQVPDTPAA